MEHSLYVIRNKINGKIYVGQTKRYPLDRIVKHVQEANGNRGYIFHKAIRRYGQSNFELILTKHAPKNEIDKLEEQFVHFYDSLIPNGYNILPYGQVADLPNGWWKGKKRSEETKRKISEKKKGTQAGKNNPFYGKTHTEETIRKLSEASKRNWGNLTEEQKKEFCKKLSKAQMGRIVSKETGEKISKALTGRKLSPEHIEKMRKSKTGKKQPIEAVIKRAAMLRGRKKTKEARDNMTIAQRARVTPEARERALKIKELLDKGWKGVDIAKVVDCTPEYVYKVKKGVCAAHITKIVS